jgi:glycosyltransferase involved in cell wall biosynthesis
VDAHPDPISLRGVLPGGARGVGSGEPADLVIRLLALVQKGPGIAPNQRFRHEQWAPYLERDHAITMQFDWFESAELTGLLYTPGHHSRKAVLVLRDALRRWRRRARIAEFDAVVVLREAMLIGGAWLERYIARSGVPWLYDFDDAIWQWNLRGINGLFTLARSPWKVEQACRLASAVTVGNEYLAEYARRFSSQVHIVRTSIDMPAYPSLPEPAPGGPFTIVWTGSHSTLQHLDAIRPALAELGRRRSLRLRVVCDRAPERVSNVEMQYVPWRASSEASDLAPAHVGIMPLPDTEAARGKCGCKALQYMAIGRPVVVSPVGINRAIVEPGVNGYWAVTTPEWVARLEQLADDAALRARLGAAARMTVEREFSARSSAGAFATVVRDVTGRCRSNARAL